MGLIGCKPNQEGGNPPSPDPIVDTVVQDSPLLTMQISGQPISLVVTTEQALIRSEPSLDAPEIARFMKGDSLLFTNHVSSTNTAIKLEGIPYNEPWLRVILEGNQMGWVYGACINFDATAHEQLKEKVLDQRAVALFGEALAQQIAIYQKESKTATTLPAFRTLYTRSQTIKDSLETLIEIHMRSAAGRALPDFFWLNELMDGMIVFYLPESNQYTIFRDLKYWQQISLGTVDEQDDAFMEVLLAAYPSDSIEYFFYGWQMPIDSIMCSMLGSHIHSHVFDKIDLAVDSLGYFKTEIEAIKRAVVNDISISDHYWLPLERIQAELEAIIERDYAFLSNSDWIEIKTRRKILKNHSENNIAVNLFEGM